MPDHPAIPLIDPAYTAEVEQLTEEAETLLATVVPLSERIGDILTKMDELEAAVDDDDFAIARSAR